MSRRKINTVGELIEKLQSFPLDMPIRVSIPEGRTGEYFSIFEAKEDHLENQSTDGDPSEYWNDPDQLEPDERLTEGDEHFKYQGKLILLNY